MATITAVPAATAARVPTTSARYMWAWTRSISLRRSQAASSRTARLVVGLVQHVDLDAERAEPLDGRAGGEGEGADLVSGSVEAQEQPGVALLGTAAAAGRQQLEQPRPRMAPRPMDAPVPRVRRSRDGALVIGCRGAERSIGDHAPDATGFSSGARSTWRWLRNREAPGW